MAPLSTLPQREMPADIPLKTSVTTILNGLSSGRSGGEKPSEMVTNNFKRVLHSHDNNSHSARGTILCSFAFQIVFVVNVSDFHRLKLSQIMISSNNIEDVLISYRVSLSRKLRKLYSELQSKANISAVFVRD